ncbi:hypothetical protein BpHYR1_041966 [Brachionus plicatilis]|uniref:Uncharacterized protein n=1 Tax=Brachionus plicatilis TaxID=10195 RepID=A0A3M7QCQ2_BRAPC|nr:hypothetical protein BpHYR1_041966 [Brachionus plicatilis]
MLSNHLLLLVSYIILINNLLDIFFIQGKLIEIDYVYKCDADLNSFHHKKEDQFQLGNNCGAEDQLDVDARKTLGIITQRSLIVLLKGIDSTMEIGETVSKRPIIARHWACSYKC